MKEGLLCTSLSGFCREKYGRRPRSDVDVPRFNIDQVHQRVFRCSNLELSFGNCPGCHPRTGKMAPSIARCLVPTATGKLRPQHDFSSPMAGKKRTYGKILKGAHPNVGVILRPIQCLYTHHASAVGLSYTKLVTGQAEGSDMVAMTKPKRSSPTIDLCIYVEPSTLMMGHR